MKKLIIIIVFVFCGILHVNSQQVTRQEAITAAINTIKYCGKQDVSETELSVFTKQKGDTVLVYEVVFPTGEMVLLSGNKSCLPVLGYRLPGKTVASESVLSHFDDIPGGLRDMIEEYIEQIEECFVNGTNIGYHAEWQELQYYLPERNNRTVVVSPLLTSIWGQDRANYGLDYNAYNYYYQGENIEFKTMKCVRFSDCGPFIGDNLYIMKKNGKTVKNDNFPEGEVWVMNLNDEFQNIENFCKGIEYIDKYATPTVREKCFSLLWELRDKQLGIEGNSKRVAFFCEVGVWKKKDIRNTRLYDPKFLKYLYNVRWNYQLAE